MWFTEDNEFSRGRFLALAGMGIATFAGSSGTAFAAKAGFAANPPLHGGSPLVKGGKLNWYTFSDYVVQEDISAYEKATGTKVNSGIYDSPETAISKFALQGPKQFDLMIVTGSFVPAMIKKGWLRKLDKSRVPWQFINRGLLGKFYDPNNDYTIPRSYGVGGVIYDPTITKRPVKTWKDFFEFSALPGISGNVIWSPSPSQLFTEAYLALGIDINSSKESDVLRASAFLKKYVKHIRAFGDWTAKSAADHTIAMAVAASAEAIPALVARPTTLRYVTPSPRSSLWIDNFALVQGPNIDQAYSYVNFEYQPARQLKEAKEISLPSPLPGLNKAKGIQRPDLLFSDKATLARCDVPVIYPKIQQVVTQQFEEVKASA
jgi:spermidine/putrescine transport system substrate-binding protein